MESWRQPRKCPFCGKMFTPVRSNQKICGSRACGTKRKSQNVQSTAPTKRIKCAECGKEFLPAQKNHTTCSPECSRARSNRQARELRAKRRAAERDGKDPDHEMLMNQFAEYMMPDPWPGLDTLPQGCSSWYSAQMMPVL